MTMDVALFALVPISYSVIASAISIIALNVSPNRRVCMLPPLLITGWLSFHHLTDIPSWYGLDSLWGLFILTYLVHIITILYVEKVTLPSKSQQGDFWHSQWNFQAARKIWNNPRWLQIKREDFSCEPLHCNITTMRFVLVRISCLLAYFTLSCLINRTIFPTPFRPLLPSDFSPEKEVILRRIILSPSSITLRETLLRLILSIHWIWIAYILLQSAHHILALIFVAILRIDVPDEWPPLFGSVREITSLHAFWGKFWHRIVYRPYKCLALLSSRNVLFLAPESENEKIVMSATLFLLSGIAHSAVSWQQQHGGSWRDTAWFLGNFVAVWFEIVVERQVTIFANRYGVAKQFGWLRSGIVGRAVGMIWVWMFFGWSVPKWQYGRIYDAMLEYGPARQPKGSLDLFTDLTRAMGGP